MLISQHDGVLCKVEVKYSMIDQLRHQLPAYRLCDLLDVTKVLIKLGAQENSLAVIAKHQKKKAVKISSILATFFHKMTQVYSQLI